MLDKLWFYNKLEVWVRRLRLTHWQIELVFDAPIRKPLEAAYCSITADYLDSAIMLTPKWENLSEKQAEEILVHELVHMILHDLVEAAMQAAPGLDKEANRLFTSRLEHELEQAVDSLALSYLKGWSI